jgi:alkaline phosphatase D
VAIPPESGDDEAVSDDRHVPSGPLGDSSDEPPPATKPLAARISRRTALGAGATIAGATMVGAFAARILSSGPPPRTAAQPTTSVAPPQPLPVDRGVPAAASQPPALPAAEKSDLFTLGVASGDPLPDGVVLWTRLAPQPLDPDGGMGPRPARVEWQVAEDARFARVVAHGGARADRRAAHAVHVEVGGLHPDRWYFYRFRADGEISPVGRTKTAPAPGASPQGLRFATASCQDWQDGLWPAYEGLAAEDLDFVVHLGDYIYEEAARRDAIREHVGGVPRTLADFRVRHALYKTDPSLQAAHASFPWVVTMDDHEVTNDYAAAHDPGGTPAVAFLAMRAAAYQAYWEHLPLRRAARPTAAGMTLYRRLGFGDLLSLNVLDTRQWRSQQPCGGGIEAPCPGQLDPDATMTGMEQERWLLRGLAGSGAHWNVIAQQTMFAQMRLFAPNTRRFDDGDRFNMDQWDGYAEARARLLRFLTMARPSNPMVLSGDLHSSWVNELPVDFDDPTSESVGVELVGTSISSDPPVALQIPYELVSAMNPNVKFFDPTRRGYVRNDVGRGRWRADFRTVDRTDHRVAPIRTTASWVIESGRFKVLPG